MKPRKEVKVIENIQNKLKEKFPNILEVAKEEFFDFHKTTDKAKHLGQVFYGWFFVSFGLYDGKKMPELCFEILDLNNDEKKLLKNIMHGISGFFEVVNFNKNEIILKDLLTKKEYTIKIVDLDYKLRKGDVLDAYLVKNLDDDYFFFGGFYPGGEKKDVKLKLLEYTRELTINEMVEQELGVIERLEKEAEKDMLLSYLKDVLEMDQSEIDNFLDSGKEKRREILKEIIEEIENAE
ncbi:MAG: hypothetical protein KKG75_02805 [Nanoarchaeota archaeon]|nr:hypothetical protein [Nanoarchaeota archaeon]